MRTVLRKIAVLVLRIAVALFLIAFAVIMYLTVREYRPKDIESLTVHSTPGITHEPVILGDEIDIVTLNVGYCALGDNADFFMDGGKSVSTATAERFSQNMAGIKGMLSDMDPDIILLQETDQNSTRSFHTDETLEFASAFPYYDHTFAHNFKVDFVPYPIPPIGKVSSGVMTLSRYEISSADRVALPCSFSWPVKVANLKRCLSVNRIPVQNSDKELVIVNLHLEAYDDGEGKEAQTKMLAEFLKQEADKGNYVIAGGDFNQSFSGTDTSAYPEYEGKWHCGRLNQNSFDPRFRFLCDPSAPTCRSLDKPLAGADKESFQYYLIDGFIVSGGVNVKSVSTVSYDFRYTDHNPVLIKVTLE